MSGPRITFGGRTVEVSGGNLRQSTMAMVPPEPDGDGTIFVSIASYRDGERCGATIKSIFDNARDPDKIIIGLVEQNDPDDAFCLEQYCKTFGTCVWGQRDAYTIV